MNSKVRITADDNGNIIGISENNPEYGYVRVEQVVTQINDDGWLKNVRRSALIKGKVQDLLDVNYKQDQELSGRIVVRESFVPFNPVNPDRDLKVAGDTGVICRVDDLPIYRQTFYTTNENMHDELIMHTNREEIKEVLNAQKAMDAIKNHVANKKKSESEAQL